MDETADGEVGSVVEGSVTSAGGGVTVTVVLMAELVDTEVWGSIEVGTAASDVLECVEDRVLGIASTSS